MVLDSKIIDTKLVRERQRTWQSLHKEHSFKKSVSLFVEQFESYPTPEEYKSTKFYVRLQHVYFITDGEFVKIGISQSPKGRLRDLQTSNPRPLIIATIIPYGDREYELKLHDKFAHLRVRGEWFKITPELQEYIDYTASYNYATFGRPLTQCNVRYKDEVQENSANTG